MPIYNIQSLKHRWDNFKEAYTTQGPQLFSIRAMHTLYMALTQLGRQLGPLAFLEFLDTDRSPEELRTLKLAYGSMYALSTVGAELWTNWRESRFMVDAGDNEIERQVQEPFDTPLLPTALDKPHLVRAAHEDSYDASMLWSVTIEQLAACRGVYLFTKAILNLDEKTENFIASLVTGLLFMGSSVPLRQTLGPAWRD